MSLIVKIIESDHVDYYLLEVSQAKHMLTLSGAEERSSYFRTVRIPAKFMFAPKCDLFWDATWSWTDIDVNDWNRVLEFK